MRNTAYAVLRMAYESSLSSSYLSGRLCVGGKQSLLGLRPQAAWVGEVGALLELQLCLLLRLWSALLGYESFQFALHAHLLQPSYGRPTKAPLAPLV